MSRWVKKSESDTDEVWAQMSANQETGRYRYVTKATGAVVEVGKQGAAGRTRQAAHPRKKWVVAAVAAPSVALAVDLVWRIVG